MEGIISKKILSNRVHRKMIPKTLPSLLHEDLPLVVHYSQLAFALNLRQNKSTSNLHRIWTFFQMAFPHLFLVFIIAYNAYVGQEITFYISGITDMGAYLFVADLLCYRRKTIQHCLKLHHTSNFGKENLSMLRITFIMGYALTFSLAYIAYSIVFLVSTDVVYSDVLVDGASYKRYIFKSLDIFYWLFYTIYVYIGIPSQIALFAYFCLVIEKKLKHLQVTLNDMTETHEFRLASLSNLRSDFCEVQELCAKTDSIFREICFTWLSKIVFRICLSVFGLLTENWSNDSVSGKIIVLLDCGFDVTHLAMICFLSGYIVDRKTEVLQSLIHMSGEIVPQRENVVNEMLFFLSLVGNSSVHMTAANCFILNRNIAVTILGVVGSYAVIIYQLSSK